MSQPNQQEQNPKHPRLGVIDGLRAIAILMIVWFHLWQQSWLSNDITIFDHHIYLDLIPRTGFLGVELLLFISGFGLFLNYAQKMVNKTEVASLGQYGIRRFFRIGPSYYLNLLLVILLTQPFTSFNDGVWHTFTHLFFIHTFFPNSWGEINGVLWTVAIEVQFYLLFPLLAYFFTKKPWLTFLTMTAVAIIYRLCIQVQYPGMIYYYVNQLPGFLDFYAGGMLSCYLFTLISKKFVITNWTKMIATVFSILSFVSFIAILNWVDHTPAITDSFSFWQAQNRQWLAFLFIVLTLSSLVSLKFWQLFLSNKFFLFIAAISYNLFLYHQVIAFNLEKYHIPGPRPSDPRTDPVWQIQFTIITIFLSVLVATILTYGFEKPLVKWGLKKFSKDSR